MSRSLAIVTRAEVLAAFTTWRAAADGYLRHGSRVEQVDQYLALVPAVLPESGPVQTFCDAAWATIRVDHPELRNVHHLDIGKSNLLARLLYGRQPLRTVPCPVHRGHWHGLGSLLVEGPGGLVEVRSEECGCHGTGWLP
jgi:hypothetical protein